MYVYRKYGNAIIVNTANKLIKTFSPTSSRNSFIVAFASTPSFAASHSLYRDMTDNAKTRSENLKVRPQAKTAAMKKSDAVVVIQNLKTISWFDGGFIARIIPQFAETGCIRFV